MTVNGANFLQYVRKTAEASDGGSTKSAQKTEYAWSAAGLFEDYSYLLSLLGSNEAGAAEAEVQANEKAANTLDESIKTTQSNVNSRVNELISQMQNTAREIQTRIENIEKDNEEKEKHQKDLQAHLQTIETCKGILENPDSTSAERTVAIEKLKAAGKGISEISEAVKTLEKTTNEEQDEVEQLSAEQDDATVGVDDAIQEGNKQMEAAAAQATAEQAKNTATATKGGVNETTSAAAGAAAAATRAAAESSSAIPVVGAFTSSSGEVLAQKYDQVKIDQGQAGSKRVPGAAKTQAQIAASKALEQVSLTMFQNLSQIALGELDPEIRTYANTFYSFLEPIGSWTEQADEAESQSEKLDSATQKASEKVEEQKKQEEGKPSKETAQNDEGVKLEFETDDLKDLTA